MTVPVPIDKHFVLGKSGRALAFVSCKTWVGHGLYVFDVPYVVTTMVFLTLPHGPTLPTILVAFGVWSSLQGLEADMFVDFSKSRHKKEPNCTPRVRLLHLRRHRATTQVPFPGAFGGGLRGVLLS